MMRWMPLLAWMVAGLSVVLWAQPKQSEEKLRETIVSEAGGLLGVPYRYGGMSRAGLDCSGLVRYVYQQAGFELPVGARAQFAALKPVEELQPGDLVFFRIRSAHADHVGLYVGEGRFIHAPVPGQRVRYEELKGQYWQQRLLGLRSVL